MQISKVRFVLLYGFDMLFNLCGLCCHLLLQLAHLGDHLVDVVFAFLLRQFGVRIDGSHLFEERVLTLGLFVKLLNLVVIIVNSFLQISQLLVHSSVISL